MILGTTRPPNAVFNSATIYEAHHVPGTVRKILPNHSEQAPNMLPLLSPWSHRASVNHRLPNESYVDLLTLERRHSADANEFYPKRACLFVSLCFAFRRELCRAL